MPTVRSPAAIARRAAPKVSVTPATPHAAVFRSVRRETSVADMIASSLREIDDAAPAPFPTRPIRKDRAARYAALGRGHPAFSFGAPALKIGCDAYPFRPLGRTASGASFGSSD